VRAADIASAQRGLLRLLDALGEACPQLLRGKHADLGVDALLSLQGQHVRMTFSYDSFRRAHFLVMLAVSAPESTWGRPPETWEPPAGERCGSTQHDLNRCSPHLVLCTSACALAAWILCYSPSCCT
jgi:hypothetical protein